MATAGTGARTLPWDWYTDPAVLRLEQERIFRRSWQYAGRRERGRRSRARSWRRAPATSRSCSSGTRTARCARSSTSAGTGARSSARAPGRGRRCSARTTPGPTGSTGGSSPRRASSAKGGSTRTSSASCRSGSRRGDRSSSSTPTPRRPPLAEFLGDVPERVAAAGIDVDALRFLQRAESESRRTGRSARENFLECYHCPIAHPGFSAVVDVSPDAYLLEASGWRMSQVGPARPEPRGTYDAVGRGRARPVPPPLPEHGRQRDARPAEPLDRADRPARARAHVPLPRLLRRRPTPTRRGSRRCLRSTPRSAPRTARSWSACRRASAPASSRAGGSCRSPSARCALPGARGRRARVAGPGSSNVSDSVNVPRA